jgi:hypothetical protein
MKLPTIVDEESSANAGKPDTALLVGESKLFPLFFGFIGLISIYWAVNGRADAFGDLSTRLESFKEIVGKDRLTFSFLIDFAYFAVFQGWLIDDDLARREDSGNKDLLAALGKYVPFFGLLGYLTLRPKLTSEYDVSEDAA